MGVVVQLPTQTLEQPVPAEVTIRIAVGDLALLYKRLLDVATATQLAMAIVAKGDTKDHEVVRQAVIVTYEALDNLD
jgi:hypothetical protein